MTSSRTFAESILRLRDIAQNNPDCLTQQEKNELEALPRQTQRLLAEAWRGQAQGSDFFTRYDHLQATIQRLERKSDNFLYQKHRYEELRAQEKSNPWHKAPGSPNSTGGEFDRTPEQGGAGYTGTGGASSAVKIPAAPSANIPKISDVSTTRSAVALRIRKPNPTPMTPSSPKGMKASPEIVEKIMGHENFISKPYRVLDNRGKESGNWTIGYGHEIRKGESFPADGISQQGAETLLDQDVREAENAVRYQVKVPLTQPQFDALTSLTYNLGYGRFGKSALLKILNTGDYEGAADKFKDYAGSRDQDGKLEVKPGSPKRRLQEEVLFRSGILKIDSTQN